MKKFEGAVNWLRSLFGRPRQSTPEVRVVAEAEAIIDAILPEALLTRLSEVLAHFATALDELSVIALANRDELPDRVDEHIATLKSARSLITWLPKSFISEGSERRRWGNQAVDALNDIEHQLRHAVVRTAEGAVLKLSDEHFNAASAALARATTPVDVLRLQSIVG